MSSVLASRCAVELDGFGVGPRSAPVVEVLGWEIDQGALTSTRTSPEMPAFAALANTSLIWI
jgi:hypothetical protein